MCDRGGGIMVIEVKNIEVEYMVGNFANRGIKDYFIRLLTREKRRNDVSCA